MQAQNCSQISSDCPSVTGVQVSFNEKRIDHFTRTCESPQFMQVWQPSGEYNRLVVAFAAIGGGGHPRLIGHIGILL